MCTNKSVHGQNCSLVRSNFKSLPTPQLNPLSQAAQWEWYSFGQIALYTANQQFHEVFYRDNDPEMTSAIRVGESEILKQRK